MPSRRHVATFVLMSALVVFFVTFFRNSENHIQPHMTLQHANTNSVPSTADASLLSGHAIAPKLGNETLKAELGRATWKYFHTMMAQFPDKPTAEESSTLKTFIHLFQRLYPCGECAEHFGQILQKFPPQVSSRSAAAVWACHVHNEVNKSLEKDIFDCSKIGEFYDCGCADDEIKAEAELQTVERGPSGKPQMSREAIERLKDNGRDLNIDLLLGRPQ